jgi:hypothetical protein
MREDSPERGHDTTIRLSPSCNESRFEMMEMSESPRDSTMTSRDGRRDGSGKRRQRSMGFNTRTALLSILATVPTAMAQNCISLAGSTQCPAFNSSSISTDSTLVGFLYVFGLSHRTLSIVINIPIYVVHSCSLFQIPLRLTSN